MKDMLKILTGLLYPTGIVVANRKMETEEKDGYF